MPTDLVLFLAIGFAAQLVDGALGMAYGLTATSALLSSGIAPAVASASVHTAEIFTTAASGAAHWRLGNVDRRLVWRLAPAGMVGGFLGAFLLANVPGDAMRPWVGLYLLLAGGVVLGRGFGWRSSSGVFVLPGGLAVGCGVIGGFLDAVGGGGWGALVTTSLLCTGLLPRSAVGTANCAEFFVTLTVSATFFGIIGIELWPVIVGLILGGVVAAPIAAFIVRSAPEKPLMVLVGALVMLLALRQLASFAS